MRGASQSSRGIFQPAIAISRVQIGADPAESVTGTSVYEPIPDDYGDELKPDLPNWLTAIIMLLAVGILVVAFVWTFIRVEPWLTDFIPSEGSVASPTATLESEQ